MQELPAAPFEARDPLRAVTACSHEREYSAHVTSTSVVWYRENDYSVPEVFGDREVWIKGFVDRVVISCATDVIATHVRSYDKGYITFDPVLSLRLIEPVIMAFCGHLFQVHIVIITKERSTTPAVTQLVIGHEKARFDVDTRAIIFLSSPVLGSRFFLEGHATFNRLFSIAFLETQASC